MTTRKTGGLITPYKGMILAESQDSLNNPSFAYLPYQSKFIGSWSKLLEFVFSP